MHWLHPNKRNEQPHSAIWLDTETDEVPLAPGVVGHTLDFGWACFQRTGRGNRWLAPAWKRFTRPAQFWPWAESCLRARTKTYLFAHNWSFDGPVLDAFRILPARGWVMKTGIIESPPTIVTWRRESQTLEMLDTLNIWKMSLARLGASIGLPKLPMPSKTAPRKEWDTYCRNDTEVIRQALHQWWVFLRDHDFGGFAPTLAAQSMRTFRHRFMEHPILCDIDPKALALARASYHGGRTEAYRLGMVKGPIHALDVNSMYPAVMAGRDYPTVLTCWGRRCTIAELRRWCDEYACVAQVRLDTPEPRYAHVIDDRLTFPLGRFCEALTTPDLITAIDRGHVKRVESYAVYDKAPIFRSFVDGIYALRLEARARGDEVADWNLRLLLNSLYGKFAQHGRVWEITEPAEIGRVERWIEVDVATDTVFQRRAFGGAIQTLSTQPESFSSHPAIAAHITAYARAMLWDLIQQAGSDHVVYCDTDSVYVDDVGRARLADRVCVNELGALKLEGTYPWILIHGAKDYETDSFVRRKGVRSKAKEISPGVYTHEQWSTLKGLLQTGDLSQPIVRQTVKRLKREYHKGVVASDGSVSPYRLRDW